MRQLGKVLYITEPEIKLHVRGGAFEARQNAEMVAHVPLQDLDGIVSFAYDPATPTVYAECAARNIGFHAMSRSGRLRYQVCGEQRKSSALRKAQHKKLCDPETRLTIAKELLRGKIANSLENLSSSRRRQAGSAESGSRTAERQLYIALANIKKASEEDVLRGIEAMAARAYYSAFDNIILSKDPSFQFVGRSRRPPKDPCNVLLSLAYTVLLSEYEHALEVTGLDPYDGLLHSARPGKTSLAMDMMEELRPLADRFVIRLVNLGMVRADMFEHDSGTVILNKQGCKAFFTAWSKNRQKAVWVPAAEEKLEVGLIPFAQSRVLADVILGKRERYQPYLIQNRKCYQ